MKLAATICTVMACIGCFVIITGSASIGESLPPTIVLAIVAVICRKIAGKKKPVNDQVSHMEDVVSKNSESASHRKPDWKREELWEDYPAPDYDAIHTYCEVAFDDSGKTYYYRTRNPKLKVGDTVYVPFGYNAPKKIGVIVRKEDFAGCEVPFPLEKTKFIIGKA